MSRVLFFAIAFVVATIPSFAHASTWDIDPAHTSVQFAIRHLMVSKVRGDFGKVIGVVIIDEQDLSKSSVEATIDATAINTRVAKRDEHLKGPDFLNVAQYPTLTFKSKKIEQMGEGKFQVSGDLTLHGVTKEVVLDVEGSPTPVKDPRGTIKMGGQATTTINRKDFGVTWNAPLETGGVVVGEEVEVIIDIELIKKAESAAPMINRTTAQTEREE